jgi:hypothetical protein
MTVLVFSDLDLGLTARRVVHVQQIDEILVVQLNKRSLDAKAPCCAALFLQLSGTCKDVRNGSRNDTHAVVSVRGICIQIDAGHGKCLATAGLAIGQDGAVETLEKARHQGLGGGYEEVILGSLRRMNLVESEVMLLVDGRGRRGGGRGRGRTEV